MEADTTTGPADDGAAAAPTRRARLRRLDAKVSPYLYVAPFFVVFGVFGLFPLATPRTSRSPTGTCSTPSRASSGCTTTRSSSMTRTSGTRSRTRSGSGSSRPCRSSLLALVIAHVLNTQAARAHLLPHGGPAAAGDVARRGRADLHPALRPRLRPRQLAARLGRHPPRLLGGRPHLVLDRALGDGHLAVDGLQRPHLPRGHAVDPRRALRGRRGRRRAPLAAVHPRHRADAASDDHLHGHHLDDRRAAALHRAVPVPAATRAAAPAGRRASTRRSSCTSTRSSFGSTQFKFGYAAAIAWCLVLLIGVFGFVNYFIVSRIRSAEL